MYCWGRHERRKIEEDKERRRRRRRRIRRRITRIVEVVFVQLTNDILQRKH